MLGRYTTGPTAKSVSRSRPMGKTTGWRLIDVTFGNEDHPACVVSATARASNEVPATANQCYSFGVACECREDVGIHRTRLQFRQRYDFNRTDRVSVLLAVRHRHVQGIVVGRAGQ